MPICLCGGSAVCQTRHRALHMFYPQWLLNPAEQTRQPHCTEEEWRSQEVAVTWRGTWEAGNPSAQSRQTPSPWCMRSAWEVQCNERARTPANVISQTLDFPLSPFCSKSSQPALTEHHQWVTPVKAARPHPWGAQSPATVTLTGFTGTESPVPARLSAALVTIIALHCTSNQGPRRVWACAPQLVMSST